MVAVTLAVWLSLAAFVIIGWPRINADRVWRVAALALVLAFSFAHQLLYWTVADNAFITYRYARNIADGYGPVFNPGEEVEGYSNFLWMVLAAMPRAMFGAPITAGAVALGVVSTLGCVLAAYHLVNRILRVARPQGPGMPGLGVAAAALCAAVSSLAAYGPSGLETPLFLFFVLATCYALASGRPVVAGVLVALATMTRPDGAVVAVMVGLWLVIQALRRRATAWAPTAYALGALVLLVPWTAWRVTAYGYLVPNVIAATTGGPLGARLRDGWDYLTGFAVVYQTFLVLAVVTVTLLVSRRQFAGPDASRARSVVWLLFVLAIAHTGLVVLIGGDAMPAWRLLAPVPPLLAVAATAAYGVSVVAGGEGSHAPSPKPRVNRLLDRRTVPIVTLAVCGVSLFTTTSHPRMLPAMHEWRAATGQLGEIGTWLGERLPPGTVVSTYDNGALAYRAGPSLVIIDAQGLTDEHIARQGQRYDPPGTSGLIARDDDYVVNARRPSVVVETEGGYAGGQHCGIDPAYAGPYEVASFRRTGTAHWVTLYVRRVEAGPLIESLNADPGFDYAPCA